MAGRGSSSALGQPPLLGGVGGRVLLFGRHHLALAVRASLIWGRGVGGVHLGGQGRHLGDQGVIGRHRHELRQVSLATWLRLEGGQRGLFGRKRFQFRRLLGTGLQAVELGERLLQLLVGRVTGQLDAEAASSFFSSSFMGCLLGGWPAGGLNRLRTQGRQRLHATTPGSL